MPSPTVNPHSTFDRGPYFPCGGAYTYNDTGTRGTRSIHNKKNRLFSIVFQNSEQRKTVSCSRTVLMYGNAGLLWIRLAAQHE